VDRGISKSEHIRNLAAELLDDIELARLKPEQLLLKARRLARLEGNETIQKWLGYELHGYILDEFVSMLYMTSTGRWTDKSKNFGWWGPLSQLEGIIESNTLMMKTIRIPDISYSISSANPNQYVGIAYSPDSTINKLINDATSARDVINQLSGTRSKVLGLLHGYVSNVYYETEFSGLSESLFETFKNKVDVLLADKCKGALDKIPAINDRLVSGDLEAVSQALNTCRRIIDAFADAVFPASDTPFIIGDNELDVKQDKTQNRINAYIYQKCHSESRRIKFRQTLKNLYSRVSTGVHNDVLLEEAKVLFLETYTYLGEVLTL